MQTARMGCLRPAVSAHQTPMTTSDPSVSRTNVADHRIRSGHSAAPSPATRPAFRPKSAVAVTAHSSATTVPMLAFVSRNAVVLTLPTSSETAEVSPR